MTHGRWRITRRGLLQGAGALAGLAVLPGGAKAADYRLVAAPSRVRLVPEPHPETEAWAYDGMVPGPTLRARRGTRLRVAVENRLPQPTTVHWHGLRVPNAMDGVPHVTQAPIEPGATFVYKFDLPDVGTFWYHPHAQSSEQLGRGLKGALIVDELEPPAVDRDIVWVLDDWRLTRAAAIAEFGNMMDMSHAGRIGNTVTINGRVPERFGVRAGERIRLRLVNAANARIFALRFAGHAPQVIALDGQPVAPHRAEDDRVVLGPGMRADVILDVKPEPGAAFAVTDDYYPRAAYQLVELAAGPEPALSRPDRTIPILSPNPVAVPDLAKATRHRITFAGGMMGSMGAAMLDGRELSMRELMAAGRMWAVNGVVAGAHAMQPMLDLKRGETYLIELVNDTAWPHPIHLHGHVFRVLARDGAAVPRAEWGDSVLLEPRTRADIAFVADNPGDWMLHCHVLEHQEGGMMALIRVA